MPELIALNKVAAENEQFTFRDNNTGKPLPGLRYRIRTASDFATIHV